MPACATTPPWAAASRFSLCREVANGSKNYRQPARRGFWREVINSNSEYYGGTGLGNDGGREAEETASDGFSQSLNVTLAPFATTVFKWTAG